MKTGAAPTLSDWNDMVQSPMTTATPEQAGLGDADHQQ